MRMWLRMRRFPAARAALVLLLAGAPARGHHSTAPYDLIHGTVINGTVTTFDWENPHAHIYLDVTGEENVIEHWTIELESPGHLRRLGWTKDTVKPADRITVTGGRAKNGSFTLRSVYVELPDGRKLLGLPGPDP
jgi:Family of unknown function (DUF6152)